MRTKLFMLMMAIGMLLSIPTISFAQGYTDEDLDFEASDSSNSDFGPTSLKPVTFTDIFEPVLITGILSHQRQTISLDFIMDLGVVTIQIIDTKGTVVLSQQINTSREPYKVINIKALPAQKYRIICYNPIKNQRADFELRK